MRGTSNNRVNGNSEDRRRRRAWLIETYRANSDVKIMRQWQNAGIVIVIAVEKDRGTPACRCYRCGCFLIDAPGTDYHVTVDRIIPGCRGGTYRRNNIRPACAACNSETGGGVRRATT